MKIAVVTEYYYPSLGGVTEHVHHFCLEALRLGHEPVIITADAGRDPYMGEPPFEIIRIGKSLPIYSNGSIARVAVGFNICRRLKEVFRSEQFDIIHIHSPFVPTLPHFAQRYADTTTVGTFHTQFNSSGYLRFYRRTIEKFFNSLDGRIAVSKLCIESMGRYFTGEYRIIPNGVDTAKFRPDCEKIPQFDDGKLNIFFLSRLEPRNGLEYLISAFSSLCQDRSDLRLIIGGDGPLKGFFKSLVPAVAKPHVHFIGRINGERPNYYSTSDIFCFPATKVSFGITILEAMAAGKPVVTFSMPAYDGIITDGVDGLLCGSPSADGLAATLSRLASSAGERKKIGIAARSSSERFAWARVAGEIINYYEEIKGN